MSKKETMNNNTRTHVDKQNSRRQEYISNVAVSERRIDYQKPRPTPTRRSTSLSALDTSLDTNDDMNARNTSHDDFYGKSASSIIQKISLDKQISLLSGKTMWTLNGVKVDGQQILEPIWLADGPHGLRKTKTETKAFDSYPATCFPTACTLACSWNVKLLEDVGVALSKECQRQRVSVLLGPGMNIKRHPCGGRNFEYFSEDPHLTGALASAMVKGIQYENKIGACIKHICVNNQETLRFRINVVIDERTLREIYLRGFEHVIKQEQKPWTVMSAYNSLNGTYCSEHSWLIQDIVRKEWGYRGLVMTDWGAINSRVASINAGTDLEMPGSYDVHQKDIKKALLNGELSRTKFNEAVIRNVSLLLRANDSLKSQQGQQHHNHQEQQQQTDRKFAEQDNDCVASNGSKPDQLQVLRQNNKTEAATKTKTTATSSNTMFQEERESNDNDEQMMIKNHHELAHRAALESIVLLKNEDDMVPLRQNCSIALIGDFCKYPRYQGMGSSKVASYKVDTIFREIFRYTKDVTFARGYDPKCNHYDPDEPSDPTTNNVDINNNNNENDSSRSRSSTRSSSNSNDLKSRGKKGKKQQKLLDKYSEQNLALIEEAVDVAEKADIVLVVAGLPGIYESEAYDRKNMDMPYNHNELIQRICRVNPNTVVLLCNGGPVAMPWNIIDDNNKTTPKAIFEGYLMGQAGSRAFVDILFGEHSPCGKLAETFPIRLQDVPSNTNFPGDSYNVEYREGLNVGYRYFDTMAVPVLFPFGHGLSYSTFLYSDLLLSFDKQQSDFCNDSEKDSSNNSSIISVKVRCKLTNTGKMPASEVVQCYVHHNQVDSMVYHPEQELKAFEKVRLDPNESKTIEFHLGSKAFDFFDVGISDWIVEKGQYEIRVGGSSRDIRLRDSITMTSGTSVPSSTACETHPPRIAKEKGNKEDGRGRTAAALSIMLDDNTFARMMGGKDQIIKCQSPLSTPRVSSNALKKSKSFKKSKKKSAEESTASPDTNETSKKNKKTVFHRNSLLKETKSTFIGRQLTFFVLKGARKSTKSSSSKKDKRQTPSSSKPPPQRSLRSAKSLPQSSLRAELEKNDSSSDNNIIIDDDDDDDIKEQKMIQSQLLNLPLRCLVLFSEGSLSFKGLDAIIDLLNGKFIKGSRQMIGSFSTKIENLFLFKAS